MIVPRPLGPLPVSLAIGLATTDAISELSEEHWGIVVASILGMLYLRRVNPADVGHIDRHVPSPPN